MSELSTEERRKQREERRRQRELDQQRVWIHSLPFSF